LISNIDDCDPTVGAWFSSFFSLPQVDVLIIFHVIKMKFGVPSKYLKVKKWTKTFKVLPM